MSGARDDDEDDKEGWAVPQRAPLLAMLATLAVLGVALVTGGHFYARDIAQRTHAAVLPFPAPELETEMRGPGEHHRPNVEPPPVRMADAMRRAAAQGDGFWQGPQR